MAYPDLEPSDATGRWITLYRVVWAVLIAGLGFTSGLAAVVAGHSFWYGPATVATGFGAWRFARTLNKRKQRETVEWLGAYVDAIDKPRDRK